MGTIVSSGKNGRTTTAAHEHASPKQGAPIPCRPICSAELRENHPNEYTSKKGNTPILRGRTAPKRKYLAPPETRVSIELRGRKAHKQSTNTMASTSTWSAELVVEKRRFVLFSDFARSSHHIRALDATKNAGYPNLDANNPSATAHEYPCPQTVFARVLRHTVGGDFSGIRTGAPLTGLCIQDTICLTRTCWRKRGSGTATGFTQLARPTRHPLDMAPRVLWGTRRSPAACRLRGARRPRVGGNHVVWL